MQNSSNGLSKGQREYEMRRAAKHGMSLDKWLAHKARTKAEQAAVASTGGTGGAANPAGGPVKPGLVSRLFGWMRRQR